jgi:starch synthase (maltosyl-transferring)
MYFTAFTATGWMIPLGFEWGFQKKCDVVNTSPEDFEKPRYDLTDAIRRAMALKKENTVLHEDCHMHKVPVPNQKVLALHRQSLDRSQEALLLVNIGTREEQKVDLEPGPPFTEKKRARDCSPEGKGEVPRGDKWRIRLAPAEVKVYIVNRS